MTFPNRSVDGLAFDRVVSSSGSRGASIEVTLYEWVRVMGAGERLAMSGIERVFLSLRVCVLVEELPFRKRFGNAWTLIRDLRL